MRENFGNSSKGLSINASGNDDAPTQKRLDFNPGVSVCFENTTIMFSRKIAPIVVTIVCLNLVSSSRSYGGTITFGSGASTFNMEFVTIGNAGNAADTTGLPNPAGAVAYDYQMGKYEVSEDMIEKFNASQSLTITISTRGTNKPATAVSWNEAARFVNWLNTSQGFHAAYNFTTAGVNDNIALWTSAEAWQLGGENLYRHRDAQYWLPSMDEWYKAAYFDPNDNSYYDFPDGSDTPPIAVSSDTADNTAVFDQAYAQGPADITLAGGLSPFGIMGLGGNVLEWEETSIDLTNSSGSLGRGIRGGNWYQNSNGLSSSVRIDGDPAVEFDVGNGFRVASRSSPATVPEPGSLAIFGSLGLMAMTYGRKRQSRR